jgi:phosphoribosylanthranilate isomerase
MRPRVKICGITCEADAELALGFGADEIGFVFAPSPRRVSPGTAARILSRLADRGLLDGRATVAVFVNEEPGAMADILAITGITKAQIHGDESREACSAFGFPWYRALRLAGAEDARRLLGPGGKAGAEAWACPRILADAASSRGYGGTGILLDGEVALAARELAHRAGKEFFLAGGIGPDNAREIAETLGPDGIDLCSGVEESPGRKSRAKLERLFAELALLAGSVAADGRKGMAHAAR